MKTSAGGIALIKQWEGLKLEAYLCPAGVWTIGYGHTGKAAREGSRIIPAHAELLLKQDLRKFEAAINEAVEVPLEQHQFDALVSLVYNIGIGAFQKSTLLRVLNAGNYDAVPEQFMRWNKAGKRVLAGLVNRRAAEVGLWAKGSFVASREVEATTASPIGSDTVKGAAAVGAAGLAATVAEFVPFISALGGLPVAVAALVIVAAVLGVIIWRWRRA
jgi:lysozyme